MGRRTLVGPATEYIAGELRATQARERWTLDDIAERTGVSRTTIARALRGESAIAVEVLIPLCEGMGVDLTVLLAKAADAARG